MIGEVEKHVTEHDAFGLSHWHLPGLKLVELLLLERGKKALHPGVVIAAPRAAHALHSLISSEIFPKIRAGELAAPVTVQNHAACVAHLAGAFNRMDAKFLFHIVILGV